MRGEDLPVYLDQSGVLVLAGPAKIPLGHTSSSNPTLKVFGTFPTLQELGAGWEPQQGNPRS